jgi:hypothetical protein
VAAHLALRLALAVLLLAPAGCSLFDDPEPATSAFCSVLVSAADPFSAPADSLDPVIADLQALADVATPAVRTSVETLLAAFEAVAAEDDPDAATELLESQQEELLAASEELASYSLGICGIDLTR